MVILYVLLVAYILAVNFYAFLLVKSLKEKEKQDELDRQSEPLSSYAEPRYENAPQTPVQRPTGKLFLTGLLGGAIAIYVCMFVFKYKRSDLLLMVLMPLFAVLNVYIWVQLFRSGFSFFVLR